MTGDTDLAALEAALEAGLYAIRSKRVTPPPDISARGIGTLRWLLSLRRIRSDFDTSGIGSEIEWLILIDLVLAFTEGRGFAITEAEQAAYAPKSTALRYVGQLAAEGWLLRSQDARDRRRQLLTPSDRAIALVSAYASAVEAALRLS